jgi:hypothetical protein
MQEFMQLPAFSAGARQVVITATVVDETKDAEGTVRATDVAGNVCDCDPVTATLTGKGAHVCMRHTFTNIDAAENHVIVTNGTPGLDEIRVYVNGKAIDTLHLKDGEKKSLVIRPKEMNQGSHNTVVVEYRGAKGSTAGIMIRGKNGG